MYNNEVILGWILGILSSPVLILINSFFERRRFLKTLNEELAETKYRLLLRVFILRKQLGSIDRDRLEQMLNGIESLHSLDKDKRDFLDRHRKMLSLSDDKFNLSIAKLYEDKTAIGPMSTPYLSAKMDSISLLGSKSQSTLINFMFHMDTLNKKAEENSHWISMSFSSSENTIANVDKNINHCMSAWISSAENAIMCIDQFKESL